MTQDIRKEKIEVKTSNDTAEDGIASSLSAFSSPYEYDVTSENLNLNTKSLEQLNNSIGLNTTEINTDGGSLDINTGGAYSVNNTSSGNYTWNYGGTGTTITIGSPNTYKVFTLPRKGEMPEEVYACGRLLTIGLIGTDVECAFLGETLLFEPGLLNALTFHNRLTLSVKYTDATYHYNLTDNGTQMVEGNLVSTVKHRKSRKRNKKKK